MLCVPHVEVWAQYKAAQIAEITYQLISSKALQVSTSQSKAFFIVNLRVRSQIKIKMVDPELFLKVSQIHVRIQPSARQ